MAKASKTGFFHEVKRRLNKTEGQIQDEKIQDFKESAIIEVKQQIQTLETFELGNLDLKIQQTQRALEKAKKDLEEFYYTIPVSGKFEDYFNSLEKSRESVYNQEMNLSELQFKKQNISNQIEYFVFLLGKLQA